MNLKNAGESIGFSESVLSSAAYFKSPSYIFTFACKFMKNDGSGYPRMLSIMKGTLANAYSLLLVVTGSSTLNFRYDGGVTIGDYPYALGTYAYMILSINSSTKTVTINIAPNKDGTGNGTYNRVNLSATSANNPDNMIGSLSVGDHDGGWYAGYDPGYTSGQYGTNFVGTIDNIVVANKNLSFAEAFP
jgi:hypothetical protein